MIDMSAPVERNQTHECECGEWKARGAPACASCRFLDGDGDIRKLVIAAMRCGDSMSLRDAAIAVYGNWTVDGRRTMQRVLTRMEREGRVRKYWSEQSGDRQDVFGVSTCDKAIGCWRYVLSGWVRR